jgi:3-oxoadipate enol-lactonase
MKLATRLDGDGPAVLWLHGYTMRSDTWRELWSLLPGWRHVGVDLPGHGASPALEAGTTLREVAAAVAAVAAEHEARRVVALSFGTMVALQLAIDTPALVSHLVLAAPALAGGESEPGAEERYLELMQLYREGASAEALADCWMTSPPDIFAGTELRPMLRFRLRRVILRHRWTELGTGAMRTLTEEPQDDAQLARLAARLCVIVGGLDMPVTRAVSQYLVATVAGAGLTVLDDLGHLCLLEDPARAAPVVAGFLDAGVAQAS